MNKVSVVINTLNEANNLSRAIASVKGFADEVVVVDMESEDSTAQIAKKLGAKVFSIKGNYVKIAYPGELFEKGNAPNILSSIAGNIFGMKEINALKLLDVRFPPAMLEQYDGPSYTLDDMRAYLNVYERPIL